MESELDPLCDITPTGQAVIEKPLKLSENDFEFMLGAKSKQIALLIVQVDNVIDVLCITSFAKRTSCERLAQNFKRT